MRPVGGGKSPWSPPHAAYSGTRRRWNRTWLIGAALNQNFDGHGVQKVNFQAPRYPPKNRFVMFVVKLKNKPKTFTNPRAKLKTV